MHQSIIWNIEEQPWLIKRLYQDRQSYFRYNIILISMRVNSAKSCLQRILIAYLAIFSIYAASNEVSIYSVSTTLNTYTSAAGSKGGGTTLYIKGNNFSPNADDIVILIGPYPCNLIAQGSTITTVSCITTPATDPSIQEWLPITMHTANLLSVTCSSNQCRYSYYDSRTPYMIEIFPNTAVGDQQLVSYGYHRITQVGDGRSTSAGGLEYILIDKVECSTLDIIQDTLDTGINSIFCKTYLYQEAGEYILTQRTVYGDAVFNCKVPRTSLFTGQNYTVRIAPKIDNSPASMIPKTGGANGHIITLPSTGFPNNQDYLTSFECKLGAVTCKVLQTSENQIKIQLPPYQAGYETSGLLTKQGGDTSTQINGYLGSHGIRFTRYNRNGWADIGLLIYDMRNGNTTQTLIEDGFRTQIGNIYNAAYSNFIDYYRGYIYAPVTGEYLFEATVDDNIVMYISKYQNNANPANMELIIKVDTYFSVRYDPYYRLGNHQNFHKRQLTQGYYYIQVIARDLSGYNFYYLSMSTPKTDFGVNIANPTYQQDNIFIAPTNIVPEIIRVSINALVYNSTYTLFYQIQNSDGIYVKYQTSSISPGASASTFQTRLGSLSHFGNYNPAVALTMYDASNNVVTVLSQAATIVYDITFVRIRPSTLTKLFKTSATSGFTIITAQEHSPGLGGSFKLNVNGVPLSVWDTATSTYSTSIKISNNIGHITNALRALYKVPSLSQFTYQTRQTYQLPDQFDVNFLLFDVHSPFAMTIDSTDLTGGSNNAITATVTTKRQYSGERPHFQSVPFELLRMASSGPAFDIRYNKIPAICVDCQYTYDSNFVVDLQSAAFKPGNVGLTLTLFSSNATKFDLFDLSDIVVTLYNQPCVIDSGSTKTNIQCTFNKQNNVPLLPAGNDAPKVHIRQFGFLNGGNALKLSNPITITSITPRSMGFNGGVVVTLYGTGFPLDTSSNSPILSIKSVGGIPTEVVDFITVSNTLIQFTFPPIDSSVTSPKTTTINIELNYSSYVYTFSDTNTLTFDKTLDPTVTGLSVSSASPVLKQNIAITGSNFDASASNMKVYLYFASNNTKKYQLGIFSVPNTSCIIAVLGGGRVGDYYVRVYVQGKGMSGLVNQAKFSYEIVIDSISPASGSIGGGYTMTIIGRNFATASGTTQVFIGTGIGEGGVNSICQIDYKTFNSTYIECTVPQMINVFSAGDKLPVVVTGRITQQSRCTSNCNFTYNTANTVYLDTLTTTAFKKGDTVTLNVNNTNINAANVTVGKVNITTVTITNNVITFAYPALPAGTYPIIVSIDGTYAYPIIQSSTAFLFTSISTTTGSNKGQIIYILGNGFKINDPNIIIYYICGTNSVILPIYEMNNFNISVEVPSNPNTACKINATKGQIYRDGSYSQSSSNTPSIVVTDQNNGSYKVVADTNRAIVFVLARYLNSANTFTSSSYKMSWVSSGTNTYIVTPEGGYLPCGTFVISVHFTGRGFADSTTNTINNYNCSIYNVTLSPLSSSIGGGGSYTINSTGFITNNINNNEIRVCGIRANVTAANQSSVTFIIPPFINPQTNSQLGLGNDESNLNSHGNIISDSQLNPAYSFDDNLRTFYSSASSTCYIGLDFGNSSTANITKIKFVPNTQWFTLNRYFDNAAFKGSNDNITWTTIYSIDSKMVHTGWNTWLNLNSGTFSFRYVRFEQTGGLSQCQLAELQFYGVIFSTYPFTLASTKCPLSIVFNDLSKTVFVPDAISYQFSKTAIIDSISPPFGPSTGNTTVTINGTNLDLGQNVIIIDGIVCNVTSATSTQVNCTTGVRYSPPAQGNSYVHMVGNSIAILVDCQPFLYMDRWSDDATWGGEVPPRDGDTVYVPQGMTLLIDQSTPDLKSIIVQGGTVIFSDQKDMTLDVNYFIFLGGQFRAGLQDKPYKHKLTMTFHGGYYDKQLPYFGNKVLGCMNCKFNLHGVVRNPTWTELNKTAQAGSNTIEVIEAVDWQVGQSIVVASTSYDPFEAEQKTITAISANKKVITVDTPFVYKHFAGIQTYAGREFIMRAEVGLLTRNIVLQGDDRSQIQNHGSHLILMGSARSGLDASLSYIEARDCGQPKIIARYCTHFHLAGEVPNSFVRGIAVHHSLARVLTIHGTHYLLVEKNVGYFVKGHNIFIEDGIETHNIIQDNLMINSIPSLTLLQSDTSVASYWITNPSNTVRRNHAAGSDFYGFWYEIKPNPDGPSATSNICPMGMPLGESNNNVAHSNRRFGLRIFNYAARQYPCQPTFDEGLINPFSSNPAIESVFSNYLLWKNQQDGLLGEILGYTTFDNFLIIDSGHSGMQFFKTNLTIENVTAQNSVIVGFSQGNPPNDFVTELKDVRGLITPRTDGFRAENITFVNFADNMTPLQSCSKCDNMLLWVTGGKTSFFKNINYQNISGQYINWNKWRRQIFIDQDGTLTKPIAQSLSTNVNQPGAITPYFQHLNFPNRCYRIESKWDDTTFCDKSITLKAVLYTNNNPAAAFFGMNAKTWPLTDLTANVSSSPNMSTQPMIIIKKSKDIPYSWAFPYAVGQYYHTHFQYGIDWTHISIALNQYWGQNDSIVIRFNYTDQRQLFEVSHYYQQQKQLPFIEQSNSTINASTCNNGDYFNDKVNRSLYLCVSGRNKTVRQWIDVTGVRCRDFCPKVAPFGTRESFNRVWSNATQWPNQTLPKAGDNVTIPYQWSIILDVNPPALDYLLVNGLLYFQDTQDLTLAAKKIWVNLGGIYIGTKANPFQHQATIILNGQKDDRTLVLDPGASGNKILAVTGALQFYGQTRTNIWTKLTAIAKVGDTTITVANASEWQVGDQIVVGPTYAGQEEDQVFKITAVSGNTLTLNRSFTYEHYGDPNPVKNSKNVTIDVRAAVGILNRNIKITKGPDVNNWGCRILLYSYVVVIDGSSIPPTPVNGYSIFDGVQVNGCGQYDSADAGIRIEKVGEYTPVTQATSITRSSIRNCNGYCVYIDRSSNITFDNNVFHFARRYTVYVQIVNNYTFTNNLLVALRDRPEVTNQTQGTGIFVDNAAYQQWLAIKFGTDIVLVTNNTVQGSKGQGFVFPFSPCSVTTPYPFAGNTAGSCLVAFAVNVNPGHPCLYCSGLSGYASQIGLMANPPGIHNELIYENMFFTDNQRGFTLRYARETDDNTMILKNSYFMGYSRPNCSSCYSDTTTSYCNDGYAIRMFTATISGETFPNKKDILNFDVICTQQAFDAKAFLTNVTFQNYQYNNEVLPYCKTMSVFRKHQGASDATGSHHLYNSPCINCDLQSLVYFSPSNPGWASWKGGCGQLDCTGSINYFIHDHDGYFTKLGGNTLQPSQLMANNQPIGLGESSCTRKTEWNGFWCKSQILAVLEYQSIAADYNTRMNWPVDLKYDGGNWTSVTNAWREWQWDGDEPMNRRLGRFWSIIVLGKSYNMTYQSMPAVDAIYQIQKRQLPSGNPNDWAIIRIYYPVPNVVIVKVTNDSMKNTLVPNFPSVNGVYKNLTDYKDVCGANNYYFEKNVIEFVINGKSNCQVRLTVSTYLQLTVRFAVGVSSFYQNTAQASVLTKIVAFLGIDPSQVKIVSINSATPAVSKVSSEFSLKVDASETDLTFGFTPLIKQANVVTNKSENTSEFLVSQLPDVKQQANELTKIYNAFTSGVQGSAISLDYNVTQISGQIQTVDVSGNITNLTCPLTFLVNNDTNACYCDIGYANISNTCTFCKNFPNTTGNASATNSSRCQCLNTYILNETSNGCYCAPNSIVDINNTCFLCTSLLGKNSSGLVSNSSQCACNDTFVFVPSKNTCQCPDPNSYIDSNGKCVSCSNVSNGTGFANATKKVCECKASYVWNQAQKACLCPSNTSIVDKNQSCFQCSTLVGKNGTGSIFNSSQCSCKETFIFSATNNTCLCPYQQSYINSQGKCFSCKDAGNSTGLANVTQGTCGCMPTFVWNQAKNACLCPPNSIVDINGSCFSCSQLASKNGTGFVNKTNLGQCSCLITFVFMPQNNTCGCPSGGQSGICGSCNNAITYGIAFLENSGNCFLCMALIGRNGTGFINSTNSSRCECSPSFVYDPSNNTCVCPEPNSYIDSITGKCVACNATVNSTGVANITLETCNCKPTYVWVPQQRACLCPPNSIIDINQSCFQCSSLIGKNGTGLVNVTNPNQCACIATFAYQPNNKTCICPQPASYVDNQTGICSSCLKLISYGIAIIDSNGSCFLCTNLIGKNGTGLYNTSNPNLCACRETFVFLANNNTCVCPDPNSYIDINGRCVICTASANATGVANITQRSCECKSNFVWNAQLKACLCPPNSIVDGNQTCFVCSSLLGKNGTGIVNASNPSQCACIATFAFQLNNTCICPEPASFIDTQTGLCSSCLKLISYGIAIIDSNGSCFLCTGLQGKNGTGLLNKTNSKLCACNDSFVFMGNNNTCMCPDSNSYIDLNGKCVSCSNISYRVANIAKRVCECKASFTWSTSKKACICKSNQIIDIGQRCYSCALVKNGTGAVNSTSPRSCVCMKTFVFNSVNNTCLCPDINSYVDSKGQCISCSKVRNGTGFADPVKKVCLCLSNYVWNPTANACLCPPKSVLDLNTTCFLCSSIASGNGTGEVNSSNYRSCACKKTFVYDQASKNCICPVSQSYVDTKLGCISCVNVVFGTGKADPSLRACICNETFVYSPATFKCVCAAGKYLNETYCAPCIGGVCSCKGALIFNKTTGGCVCANKGVLINNNCYSCVNANSTGRQFDNNTCQCLPGYTFINTGCRCPSSSQIYIGGQCVECKNTVNTNFSGKGVVSLTNGAKGCSCVSQFTWIASQARCICGVNSFSINSKCYKCNSFANTVSTTQSDLSQCVCINNLIFDTQTFSCTCDSNSIIRFLTCVACDSTVINGVAKLASNRCSCPSTLTWNTQTLTCIRKARLLASISQQIDCSTVAHSVGQASADGISCLCKDNFVWNPMSLSCSCQSNSVLVNGKCKNCDLLIGALMANPEVNECVCLGTMEWNSQLGICTCGANQIVNADGVCSLCHGSNIANPPLDSYNCRCQDPYFWDNLQNSCIKCDSAINAYAKSKGYQLSCDCLPQYEFDSFTNQCRPKQIQPCSDYNARAILDCSKIPNVNLALSAGPLKQGAFIKYENTKSFLIYKKQGSHAKCDNYQCYCEEGYYWSRSRKRCSKVFK